MNASEDKKQNETFEDILKAQENLSFWSYLTTELTRGYVLENDEARYMQKRERVYTFIRIPKELEKMMTYGFFLCMDAFLFIFTFLPLRVIIACLRLLTFPCSPRGRSRLKAAEICDLLKVVILVVCTYLLDKLDISMLYHIVRGQAVIKLYIIYNMLEVADKLFSSVGQDILDALFWTATEKRDKKRDHLGIVPHLLLAIIYVTLHAILAIFQATTLNVAFNSFSTALLTIMMSNNFVELKGSVFKKFDKFNLYQISCSDVRERYHYMVLLFFVVLRNMAEFSWSFDHFCKMLPDVLMVLSAEVLIDWVKHAFISKFNALPASTYTEFRASLAYDMVISRKKNAFSDHSDLVARRMGFIPLPLACVVIRIIRQTVKLEWNTAVVLISFLYLCLVAFKILLSIVLMGKACQYVREAGLLDRLLKKKSDPPKFTETGTSSSSTSAAAPTKAASEPHKQTQTATPPTIAALRMPSCDPGLALPLSPTTLQSLSSSNLLASDSSISVLSRHVEAGEAVRRPKGAVSPKSQPTDISEIDRYTLCGNRIV
ncbi:transmembrane anterior posterior transformation protein 1 homolog isoform X1 [Strongylocentrotus purpuratus]|uniref:Transmembrane anterior posterior transformation protein 1 homolog n=1 Tax=Strongylocentrotus purpuratus TaxID=7668 RepID=A0A7M7G033_STRPU|nr:transmembrane anterior posterior transformation protein 1 homolog isoform X1 [Strongylocentrotus purpuratus]|eukprot:XP_001190526.2 PREDICTED: transmembrane anterior posterior transformation protein 1 homolog isoform X1 [Strongylocentrotus purpuratus]